MRKRSCLHGAGSNAGRSLDGSSGEAAQPSASLPYGVLSDEQVELAALLRSGVLWLSARDVDPSVPPVRRLIAWAAGQPKDGLAYCLTAIAVGECGLRQWDTQAVRAACNGLEQAPASILRLALGFCLTRAHAPAAEIPWRRLDDAIQWGGEACMCVDDQEIWKAAAAAAVWAGHCVLPQEWSSSFRFGEPPSQAQYMDMAFGSAERATRVTLEDLCGLVIDYCCIPVPAGGTVPAWSFEGELEAGP